VEAGVASEERYHM